jgi:hypothetical protein
LAADAARILKQDAQTNKKQINKHKTNGTQQRYNNQVIQV